MRLYCFLLLCWLAAAPAICFSQTVSVADVLKTAQSDLRIRQQLSARQVATDLRYTDPWVRQVAARVGINGSALGDTIYGYLRNEDTYNLQVSFNSYWERQQQKNIKKAQVGLYAAKAQALGQEAFLARYEVLTDYLYAQPQRQAWAKLDSLLVLEHDMLRQMLSAGLEIKVNKVLSTEEDRNRCIIAIRQIESDFATEKKQLEYFIGPFSTIEAGVLPGPADFKIVLATLPANIANTPVLDAGQAKIQLEAAQLNLVNSQNRQIFNNVNVGYQRPLYLERPKRFNTFNNFSFRVGLTVPLPGNNNYRKAQATLDLLDARQEQEWTQFSLQRDLKTQRAKVDGMISEYDLAEERYQNSLIRQMLQNPVLVTQITPLEYVELQIAQQKILVDQAKRQAAIAKEYVRLLDLAGMLSANPDINYLSKNRSGF